MTMVKTKKDLISFIKSLGLRSNLQEKFFKDRPAKEVREFLEGFDDIEDLRDYLLIPTDPDNDFTEKWADMEDNFEKEAERESWYYRYKY